MIFADQISSSVYYVPFILLAVILCKVPEFTDEFFIISELRRLFVTLCMDNACHLTVFLVPTLIEVRALHTPPAMRDSFVSEKIVFASIGFNVLNLSQTAAVLLSTRWVLQRMSSLSALYDVRRINVRIQKKHGFSDIDTVEHSLSVSVQQLKLHNSRTSLAHEHMFFTVTNLT